jgi:hypothetical protein
LLSSIGVLSLAAVASRVPDATCDSVKRLVERVDCVRAILAGGQYAQAVESARRMVSGIESSKFAATDSETEGAATWELLAEALLLAGQAATTAEALDAARRSVADAEVRFGSDHTRFAQAEQLLARVLAHTWTPPWRRHDERGLIARHSSQP